MFLWNLSLTAGFAILLAVFCRLPGMQRRPALVHWLWLLLLVKLVTPPLIPLPVLPAVDNGDRTVADTTLSGTWAEREERTLYDLVSVSMMPRESKEGDEVFAKGEHPPVDLADDVTVSAAPEEPSRSPTPPIRPSKLHGTTPFPYAGVLLTLSLFGTCVLLTVYTFHAVRFNRWLKRAGAEDSALAECSADVACSMGICGKVRSVVVDARTAPLLWAWRRPIVAVPRQLVDELEPIHVRSIVAHEFAHLVRRDHWANLFVCFVKAFVWWNPVVWWADRELRVAQEMCCDAMAIEQCKANRSGYAATLLKTLDFVQPPVRASRLALGMGSRGTILRRFEMIGEKKLSYRVSQWAMLVMLVLGVPLICIPVRGQEAKPAAAATSTATESTDKDKATSDAGPAETGKDDKGEGTDREKSAKDQEKQVKQDFGAIARLVSKFRDREGRAPENLNELNEPLPKDVYSPSGEEYHYKPERQRFILGSCGQDGVYGNDDDEILITYWGGATSGQRRDLFPSGEEKVSPQKERSLGQRPKGNCSISGKVVSAETGEPIARATVYLFYLGTHGSIFVDVASDGTFVIKDIPTGPFFLQTNRVPGYQDEQYRPEGGTAPLQRFSLKEGEQRTGIVFRLKPACQISGKVVDENGNVPDCIGDLTVLAWVKKDDEKGYRTEHARLNRSDGTYSIDGLDKKPVYVMVINWKSNRVDDAYPPIYYPSTFSRDEAKQITFEEESKVEGVDITLKKEGGLVLEGTVTDESGKPVPEAFVVIHRRDMLFDFVTDYTDEQGKYRIDGLGKGEFQVHVDAAQRGLVRMRTPIDLDGSSPVTHRDFTLAEGLTISGKFVDEEGKDWPIAESYGYAATIGEDEDTSSGSYSLTGFRNKFGPKDVQKSAPGSFSLGEGGYRSRDMIFPTKSTFVIQGMMPGHTKIGFFPKKVGEEVLEIRCDDRDIKESGINTEAGKDVKDVTIVIGKKKAVNVSPTAVDTDKDEATAPSKPAESGGSGKADSMDPEIEKLGGAAHRRWNTFSDEETLTLKDGETGRVKVKKNMTAVTEILVTPHVEADGTRFDVEGLDADGEPVEGVRVATKAIPDGVVVITSKGLPKRVDGKRLTFKIQLTPWSQDDGRVIVEVKVLLAPQPTPREMAAMRLTKPKPTPSQRPRMSIYGKRPTGNCSIGGKVVSAETGEPLRQARVMLHYFGTESSMFVQVDTDAKFLFKEIPRGPFRLHTSNIAGYQDAVYEPDSEPLTADRPGFTLADGEQRLDLVLKAKPACRISGKILDTRGAAPEDPLGLRVDALFQKDGRFYSKYGRINPTDGSYAIDGLDKLPVYVMVTDERAKEGNHFPPVYYPSTFSRTKAKQIVFGDNRSIEDVDVTLRNEGGLTLEGKVVDEEGNPVPKALVLAQRSDMYTGSVSAYTDERGQYHMRGLGDGEFRVHVDVGYRGYVRTRALVDLGVDGAPATCDFTLTRCAMISGRLVNEEGSDWQIGYSYGFATTLDKEDVASDFGGGFSNKYGPADVGKMPGSLLQAGEGNYASSQLIFPTKSTFAVFGMMPGNTRIHFYPRAKDQEVLAIRYEGRDVLESGFDTAPGEKIEDVEIVIGKKKDG